MFVLSRFYATHSEAHLIMRIAVIGKSAFGADVYKRLIEKGHNVVVVCTELDKNGRADLLGMFIFITISDI